MFNRYAYRDRPFPTEAVRDLLGIARAAQSSHRAAKEHVGQRVVLLARAVTERDNALNLSEHRPGSLAHVTAWKRAERGTEQLCQSVESTADLAAVVRAASVPLQLAALVHK